MKKTILASLIVLATFVFSSVAMATFMFGSIPLSNFNSQAPAPTINPQPPAPNTPPPPPTPNGNVINACFKKNNGQLRIVSNFGQCLPSEIAISWNIVGPQGPPGPQGPSGVVATSTFSGGIGAIPAGATQFVFAGPTANVTTTASQGITGAVQAPLGTTSTSGTASFGYDLCYRAAGTANTLINFAGPNNSVGEVSESAGRLSFTAAASVLPGAGTWEVGYCVLNSGTVTLDDNSNVNGWVVVTEMAVVNPL